MRDGESRVDVLNYDAVAGKKGGETLPPICDKRMGDGEALSGEYYGLVWQKSLLAAALSGD